MKKERRCLVHDKIEYRLNDFINVIAVQKGTNVVGFSFKRLVAEEYHWNEVRHLICFGFEFFDIKPNYLNKRLAI